MEFKSASIEICVDSETYVVRSIPAYVCERCGEKVMSQEVTSRVYELINRKEAETHIQVPVFEYI